MFELLKFLLNPAVIVAVALTWVGTSTYHRFTEWINQGELIRPWARAVEDRDQAVKFKDTLILAVSKDKELGDEENERLREALEKAEAARRAAGTAECVWSATDRRMLNRGTRAGSP